jgi:integrase
MRGSIVKRGARFYVVVDAPGAEDGERKQKWIPAGKTRDEADRALVDIVGRMHRGIFVDPNRVTLGGYLTEQWLPAIAADIKPSTHELYTTLVRAYIKPRLGSVRLQSLTPAQVKKFETDLLIDGAKNGRPLSPKSVRNVHTTLHRALADALALELVVRNVAAAVKPPRGTPSTVHAWTADEVAAFLDNTDGDRLYPLWVLLATTGMRRGEALALRWSDLDMSASRVTVMRTASWVGKQVTFTEPKTRAGRRLVPLSADTVAVLREHRKLQAEERLAAGSLYGAENLVFADELGQPFNPSNVTRAFGRAVQEGGLPPITLHGLRHSFATIALGAHVPVKVVSEVIGHSSTAITQDLYMHVTPGMADDAMTEVANIIGRGRQ